MKFDLLNKQLIGFAYLLRSAGFQASPDQSKSFLMAIRALGPESLKDIRLAARSVFGPSPEKSEIFDELFDQHFLGAISIHAFDGDKEDSVSEQAAEHLGEVEQGIEDQHGLYPNCLPPPYSWSWSVCQCGRCGRCHRLRLHQDRPRHHPQHHVARSAQTFPFRPNGWHIA